MSGLHPAVLLLFAALAYLAGAVFYGAATVRKAQHPRRDLMRAGTLSAIIGAALHTAAIGARCAQTHMAPFVTPPDALSAVGLAIALAFLLLLVCPLRERMLAVGAVAMPLAFLFVFAGSAIGASSPVGVSPDARELSDNLVAVHVLAIVLAFGFLALAGGCAALYLAEDRMLKRKSVAQLLFWRLPSLRTVDNLAFSLVSLALPLLTVGILAGIIRAITEHRPFERWSVEPQTLASLATWALYAVYLWVHIGSSWRGARVNAILLLGLVAEITTYFAPSTLHHFG